MGSNEGYGAERYAVVSGANKGIGYEVVRQLAACQGVVVVLTARDEKRGRDATSQLHHLGFSNVLFHQLDVLDPFSIQSLANFIDNRFGRLDILVREGFYFFLFFFGVFFLFNFSYFQKSDSLDLVIFFSVFFNP